MRGECLPFAFQSAETFGQIYKSSLYCCQS